MKLVKKAFTLAEVLITLVVIGTVAALTIPSLVNNIGDQQNKVAWRKAFSDLSQATMMVVADNGGSLVGAFPGNNLGGESLKNAFAAKLNVIKNCAGTAGNGGSGLGVSKEGCWHNGANSWLLLNGTGKGDYNNAGFVLNNGTLVYFWVSKSDCSEAIGDYTRCGWAAIDVNGFKKPNTVGKDIFYANVTSNSMVPWGAKNHQDPSISCIEGSTATTNNGYGCSAKYLYQ